MKAFVVKVSNFKEGILSVQMHSSIHCSHWSVHLDIWAAWYLFVLKFGQQPHVAWNNYGQDKKGEKSLDRIFFAACVAQLQAYYVSSAIFIVC